MERKAYQRREDWQKFEILETVASCQLSIRKACRIPISPKTIYNILKAQGWLRQRKQRVRAPEPLLAYPEPREPNEVWQADFMYI